MPLEALKKFRGRLNEESVGPKVRTDLHIVCRTQSPPLSKQTGQVSRMKNCVRPGLRALGSGDCDFRIML